MMNRRTMKSCFGVVSMALVLVGGGAGSAGAQETTPPPVSTTPPPVGGSVGYFGEHGQVVISGEFKFNILRESLSMGRGERTTYEIQPSVDYFVSSNVSVGGLLGFAKDANDTTTITFGGRVGYNVVLTNSISIWGTAGLSYNHFSYDLPGTMNDGSGYTIPLRIFVPFLWHPATHFFIGAGPFLATDLVSKFEGADGVKRTDIGIASTVGGYFGGL